MKLLIMHSSAASCHFIHMWKICHYQNFDDWVSNCLPILKLLK